MPPIVAFLLCTALVIYAYRSDRTRDIGDTHGLLLPTIWYLVVASRPVGYWLNTWGVPLPSGSDDPTDGSLVDRMFYAILTAIGLSILSRRKFNWGETFRRNPWLTAFIAYMALSIIWSHYPYVSFKRYIKVVGSVVMAMVVLSTGRPLDSIFTVIRRCLYIHLPMSILCTRYYRDIGVAFEFDGHEEFWQGISTSKNTLGQITMLGVLYFTWEIKRNWKQLGWRNLHFLYLLMALFLLKGSDSAVSMTSVVVTAFSLFIFFRIQALRGRPDSVRKLVNVIFRCTAGFIVFILIHSVVMFSPESMFGKAISMFGRDVTLTDRTFIWSDAYAAASGNPLLGVGFGGFWIGRVANIPWNEHMSWVLGQAHSGYVDTYLQLGLIGGLLLAVVFFTTMPRLVDSLTEDYDLACFRITLFLTILFVNITESVYLRGDHHLWLIFMLVLWFVPATQTTFGYRTVTPVRA